MECKKCGKKIDEKDNVCRFCGEVLNKERLEKIVPKNCPKCGDVIKNDEVFCKNCGFKFIKNPNSVENNENQNPEESKKGRNLSLIALALIIISYLTSNLTITFIGGIVGVILLVYSNIKYPNNKETKAISKGIIISLIVSLVLFIICLFFFLRWTSIIADGCQGSRSEMTHVHSKN